MIQCFRKIHKYARGICRRKIGAITINNGNLENNRNDSMNPNTVGNQTTTPPLNEATSRIPASDATQRIHVDGATSYPRQNRQAGERRSATTTRSASRKKHKRMQWKKFLLKNKKAVIIASASIAAVLVLSLVVAGISLLATPEDDGLILSNVYAAGVNLGGKTPEQAKQALIEATEETYSKLDMIVTVHTSQLVLSPSNTGAKLNVDSVIEAAYNYGRVGSRSERQNAKNQALTTPHYISIIPHLTLDTLYIRNEINALGEKYSSTLSQTTYRVEGTAPDMNIPQGEINTDTVYQTLYINLGTAEYGLNTNQLYDQILEAYNANIFQVDGNISVVTPDSLDLQAIYDELACFAPVDATLDDTTFDVTPGKYGYGFILEDVQAALDAAEYGTEIKIPLTFLRPSITEEDLNDGLFEKELANFSTAASIDQSLLTNLKLACSALNNVILRSGDSLSFNELVGVPTTEKGYAEVTDYVGKVLQPVVGGGASQVSSALYYCALKADLEIVQRHSYDYAPSFIEAGFDAYVNFTNKDLVIKNNTGRPIQITAEVTGTGSMVIRIFGTENKEYTTEVLYETVKTYAPGTLTHIMRPNNPEGYVDGDVLVQPITGYDVATYHVYRYADETKDTEKILIANTHYDSSPSVVVKIEKEEPNPDDDESSTPDEEGSSNTDENESSTPGEENSSTPGEEDSSDPGESESSTPGEDESTTPNENE